VYCTLATHCKENAKGATLATVKQALADVGGGKLEVALNMLVDARIAGRDRQRRYRLLTHAAPAHAAAETARERVAKAAAQFEQMSAHDKDTLQKMIDNAQTGQCRWRAILDYYSDTPQMEHCGVCDNCVNPPQIDVRFDTDTVVTDVSSPIKPHAREPRESHESHQWAPGDPVRVPRYGAGEVALASGEQVAVQFPDGRTRTFMSSYVRAARRSPA
jgi:ATP-dependent DNA helicase RecQ